MSLLEWRGGFPAVFRGEALGTTPVEHNFATHLRRLDPEAQEGRYSPGPIKWLRVQNHDDTNGLRLYFFQSHADAGEHYVLIQPRAAGNVPVWEGPVEAETCWVAGDGGAVAAYDITGFMRRP